MLRFARYAHLPPVMAFASLLALGVPEPKQAAVAAPVPQQILSAHKVFISNGGGACDPFDNGQVYSGGPDRAYNQFYAAMKNWGRYELVPAPADADVAFEISFTCPNYFTGGKAGANNHSRLSLVIRDVKTHTVLWKIIQEVRPAALPGHRNTNFDRAMHRLVLDLENLTKSPPAASR